MTFVTKENVPDMKFQLSIIAFMVALSFGCVSSAWNPDDHHVSVERVPSDQARISRIYMLKKAEGILVEGELRPNRMTRAKPPGHVVVEVIGPDGTTVERVSAHYRRTGKVNKPAQRYAFSVPLAGVPPAGSTVRVIHDGKP